ncbi:MAG: helix-turn-helix transcriptional regulator [Acidimicrobiales bacterium]
MSTTTSLVPPRRLGALLRQARLAAGRELADLASGAGLSVVELDDVEHGRRDLDEPMLAALVDAYGIAGAGLVPERSQLVIDLDEGRIAVNRTDIDVDPSFGPDAILTRYLALVYRLRDLSVGTPLQLRDVDVDVLSVALSLAGDDVDARLRRLMNSGSDVAADQRRIRRQLLLPLVGVVIAATGMGTLVLVADRDAPPAAPVGVSTELGAARISTPAIEIAPVQTELGAGGAVEFNADS